MNYICAKRLHHLLKLVDFTQRTTSYLLAETSKELSLNE